MLKELFANFPITRNFTPQELDATLTRDFILLIREKTSVDLSKGIPQLDAKKTNEIVAVTRNAYEKILASKIANMDMKKFIAISMLGKFMELLRYSPDPVNFFKLVQQNFTPAQIVTALLSYLNNADNLDWLTNFFRTNPQLFPTKNKKIRTIALYYKRMYSGGVERILSIMIPIYLSMGYRVVLFTDEYKPELEYPLPPPCSEFKRVILNPHAQLIDRLAEIEKKFAEESVDLFITHEHWRLPPVLHILLSKLCQLKFIVQSHNYFMTYTFDFKKVYAYRLADTLITLTNMSKDFWKNLGMRAEFIPHPIIIEGAENFHGRDAKNCSNTILYVGRIAKADDKNTFAILPILNEVVKIIPNVKLKILGEVFNEEVFQQMKKFIAENHLESNVEFCGYHKDVGKFYEEADLILSTSPSEGWGLFIVESKFYELPLVLYELPDVETLRDGKGYIAVPQGDFRAAAQAVVKILTDTEFRCKMSAEARESLQSFIDYDIAGAWQKVFDDLDNNTPIPPHNINAEKIQTLLLKEIWKEKFKNQVLTAQVNYLAAQLQQKK